MSAPEPPGASLDEQLAFRLATRGSALALWQAKTAQALLLAVQPRRTVEFAIVQSSGDRDRTSELASFGSVGIFTVEIDNAVLDGRADAGVHSMKDMTTVPPEGIALVSALARGPVEDVLVAREARSLAELPRGARVATGSRRRRAQLLRERPDLEVVDLRGNVETRLDKIARGEADACILARAGLERLGLAEHVRETLGIERFVPAVGQGIVGLVCRVGDERAAKALRAIGDPDAWAAALCERAFLRTLQGGCSAPIGGHARVAGNAIALHGQVLSVDGKACLEDRVRGTISDAEALGRELAERLLERGAGELLAAARER